jgi:hypothetical protein
MERGLTDPFFSEGSDCLQKLSGVRRVTDDVIVVEHDQPVRKAFDFFDNIGDWSDPVGIAEKFPDRAEFTAIRASPADLNHIEWKVAPFWKNLPSGPWNL